MASFVPPGRFAPRRCCTRGITLHASNTSCAGLNVNIISDQTIPEDPICESFVNKECLVDVDGPNMVNYVVATLTSVTCAGVVTNTELGTFTDETLDTSYTVVGTPTNPSLVGQEAVTAQERFLVSNGQQWSPVATMRSYTIRVITNSGNGTLTYTDTNGVTTELSANEVVTFDSDVNNLFNTDPIVATGPGDVVVITATDIGVA